MSAAASFPRAVELLQQRDGEFLEPQLRQLTLPLLLAVSRPTSSSPSPEHHGAKSMERVSGTNAKTFGELPVDRMSELEVAEVIADALARDYGDFKFTDKLIGKDTGASPRTASNWRQKMNTPSLPFFLRLWARSPAVQAAMRELTTPADNTAPKRASSGS